MSIPRSTAQTEAQTNHDADVAAANARFIAAVDQQITDAIALGFFYVNSLSADDIDPMVVGQYYSDLGYIVSFPDFPQNLILQPAELFGEFWINFWTSGMQIPTNLTKPYRFIIAWK
jgi:hypothetical protein